MLAASIQNLFLTICFTLDVVKCEIYKTPKPMWSRKVATSVFFVCLFCCFLTAVMCLFICVCFGVCYSMLYLGLNCPKPNKEAQEVLSHCKPPLKNNTFE